MIGIFKENSPISMVRVMSIISLLIGAVIGLFGVYRGTDLGGVAEVCAVFVVSAFGGKVLQKGMEK